jgi:hypothetical protein
MVKCDQLGTDRIQIYHLNTTNQPAGPGLRFYDNLEFRLVAEYRLHTTPSQKQVYKLNVVMRIQS